VHLRNVREGTPLDDLDEGTGQARARQVLRRGVARAYPEYSALVRMDERTYGPSVIAA
jgi:hypothetical protein